ncbi:PadR family transcriptional regulator [Rothia sp. ZJ932]|uniref:PadR family transcriptional regulator n=2 Tax=unclassified Rothia (in: high G+C Gram-positive bacteria) TaxID=2689056 RepID=UPI001F074F41|nr:PadR family transcriptional regulator [Rothia sp. ZJ932]
MMSSKDFATWQRAVLPLLLLQEIKGGATHGYALGKALIGRGFEPIKGATLYPALAKLEEAGYLETHWQDGDGGPGRKMYAITAEGEQRLAQLETSWKQFVEQVALLPADVCGALILRDGY